MKKKVLVMSTTFPRWKNDTTPRFVYELSKRLASNYDITVLAPHHKNAAKNEKSGRIEIRRFVYFKPESLQKLCYNGGIIPNMQKSFLAKIQMPLLIASEFLAASRIIKKEHIDMIHAHWMLPQGFVAVCLKKLFSIPLLVTVHGSDLFPLKNVFFKRLQSFVVGDSDFVTVNSIATKNELTSRFEKYKEKIRVIPMGIDTNLFRKRNIQKPKKYEKNKILLFVGRLSEQKGLQFLVYALADVIKAEQRTKLLVIGEGFYKNTVSRIVQEKNLGKYVEFLGPMTQSDLSKFYNYADVFVMPSLSTKTGTEALGLALLEAMASGCAVIATKVGGMPSIIKHNQNGLLVEQKSAADLSNAIIMLFKDKKKSRDLGNNAAKFASQNYSWDKVSKEFMKVYKGLLQ